MISPSGNEVGPFLSIEQAALSQIVRTSAARAVFAWYNLAGSFATALGALAGGGLAQALQRAGVGDLASYRAVVSATRLSGSSWRCSSRGCPPAVEAAAGEPSGDAGSAASACTAPGGSSSSSRRCSRWTPSPAAS